MTGTAMELSRQNAVGGLPGGSGVADPAQLELSLTERSRLKQHEEVIARTFDAFVECGRSLKVIRDERLYRGTHETFEEYCREKWAFSRQRAHQLIESSEVVGNLSTMVDILPATERQARPLVGLPPETQREVWQQVLASAPDGKITAQKVVEAARHIQAEKTEARRVERVEKIVEISKGNKALNFPVPCSVVICDPPWRYDYAETENRAVENHYPTMPLSEICALPFRQNTTGDCVLFLWVTSPKLFDSHKLIESWGLTYRTCAVWIKDKIGMGYYFRQQHELLLVATRGNPPAPSPSTRVSSLIKGKRTKHSAKPDIYGLIEKMYPRLPKGEMFQRAPRKGWHGWGNQV